jgi:hypothetical protein
MPRIVRLFALSILLASLSPASAETAFEAKAICRAALAAITGRDLKLFQAMDAPDGTIALTYARAFDNFVWSYHCRIEGNRVIWADEPGRWRQDARDEKVTFGATGSQLRITRTPVSGAVIQEVYERDKFLER